MASRVLGLYHVTSYERAVRILDSGGIDPKFSQGRNKTCWYVTKQHVPWAIAHIAHRHQLQLADISILFVRCDTSKLLKTSKGGVYCSSHVLRPIQMDSAEMWLSRQEQKIYLKQKVVRGNGFAGRQRKEEDELS